MYLKQNDRIEYTLEVITLQENSGPQEQTEWRLGYYMGPLFMRFKERKTCFTKGCSLGGSLFLLTDQVIKLIFPTEHVPVHNAFDFSCVHTQLYISIMVNSGVGELMQLLRILAAYAEDPGLIPNTHVVAHNYLQLQS